MGPTYTCSPVMKTATEPLQPVTKKLRLEIAAKHRMRASRSLANLGKFGHGDVRRILVAFISICKRIQHLAPCTCNCDIAQLYKFTVYRAQQLAVKFQLTLCQKPTCFLLAVKFLAVVFIIMRNFNSEFVQYDESIG